VGKPVRVARLEYRAYTYDRETVYIEIKRFQT
jgi:hypothetical protein